MKSRDAKLNELKRGLNSELANNNHVNDGSFAANVNERIQWAWENWDKQGVDLKEHYDGEIKPECYTDSFRESWIENEDFDEEICED